MQAGNTGEDTITFPAVNASLVTFFPAEGAYVTDNTTNITIAFGLPVVTRSGERITDTNAALNTLINPNINVLTFIDAHTLVTLKKKNGGAGGVDGSDLTTLVNTEFAANSNSNSNPDTITINPAANLADGTYTTRLLSNEANEVITSAGRDSLVGHVDFHVDTTAPEFSYETVPGSLTVGTLITRMSPTIEEANPKDTGGYFLKSGLPPGLKSLHVDTGVKSPAFL